MDNRYYINSQKVAVLCWYTSSGRTLPKMIRFENEEGERITIADIEVLETPKDREGLCVMQSYKCKTIQENKEITFLLLFHPGENIWELRW